MKIEITGTGAVCRKSGEDEIIKNASALQHMHGLLKEFGKDNEIHGNVFFSGGKDLLGGILVQKEKIPLCQDQFFGAVDNMSSGAGTHVDHFYIIMAVPGKMDKSGMGTYLDQFSSCQQLAAVYDKISGRGIKLTVYVLVPFQDPLFFRGNLPKSF